jgi:hypothetical protein
LVIPVMAGDAVVSLTHICLELVIADPWFAISCKYFGSYLILRLRLPPPFPHGSFKKTMMHGDVPIFIF